MTLTVTPIGYDHPMMNLMNETVVVPTIGISATAVGLRTNEVYVFATTCRECGTWDRIGGYSDSMCWFCT